MVQSNAGTSPVNVLTYATAVGSLCVAAGTEILLHDKTLSTAVQTSAAVLGTCNIVRRLAGLQRTIVDVI